MTKKSLPKVDLKQLLHLDHQLQKRKHDYQHHKTPLVPEGIDKIPLGTNNKTKKKLRKANVIPQKSRKSPFEQLHCTQNQNYPLFFIEKAEALRMRKVKNFRVKEHLIATRNIKRLSNEMQKWIYFQIHQDIKIVKENPVEFYHLLEKREERHFQIDRMIKLLSGS
ncbi:MAG: hypothetical protein K1000chlam2_00234 [Chlamydiae bacterium]|nr:hypothetical protein [Chlamydiota bacterium]